MNGRRAVQWLYREAHGPKDEFYRFYFDAETEEPLLLSMMGQDYFTGAHYDEYIANFTFYKAGMPEGSVFAVPDECDNGRARARPAHSTLGVNMRAFIPRVHSGTWRLVVLMEQLPRVVCSVILKIQSAL